MMNEQRSYDPRAISARQLLADYDLDRPTMFLKPVLTPLRGSEQQAIKAAWDAVTKVKTMTPLTPRDRAREELLALAKPPRWMMVAATTGAAMSSLLLAGALYAWVHFILKFW